MRKPSRYYDRERRKGRVYSAIIHLLAIVIAILGLPSFLSPRPPEEPMAITVEVLPITGITNVKPSEPAPPQEPKKEEAQQKKEAPPVKVADSTPPPPPPPEPAPKPEPKKEIPKKEEPKKEQPKKPEETKKEIKKKPKDEDLAAVLKAVKETAQKEKKTEDKNKKAAQDNSQSPSKSISNNYNPDLPMSLSEKDAIRSQIAHCWVPPIGAKDAQDLVVMLHLELSQDGTVTKVELANGSAGRYNSDSFFRAAADSAMRAVRECSPLKNLPPEKYQTWHDMELTFDPKEMLL
ncbi:MAG: hypothetical protein KGJ06_05310 [Pseudomonadota bacterium]|nr:hypothetical protein [Pseudomonadota bacterium]